MARLDWRVARTLDAFDFTILLLLMVPISGFSMPLTEVAAVFTLTLWMRLVPPRQAGSPIVSDARTIDDLNRLVLGLQSVGREPGDRDHQRLLASDTIGEPA